MDLHILKYNNYFNRFFKRENSLSAYLSAASEKHVITATNFNEADGVSTAHVVNFSTNQTPFEGDYAILADGDQIVSRWFILENQWIRRRQYVVTLRRDLVVDYFSSYADSGFYIRYGCPKDINDPAIWNTDPVSFNEIRKEVRLLRDPTRTSWAILYVQPLLGEKAVPNTDPNEPLRPYIWPDVELDIDGRQKITIASNRIKAAEEMPYSILAIPLFEYRESGQQALIKVSGDTNMYGPNVRTMQTVQLLCEALGGRLYDAQVLPYSPFGSNYYRNDGRPGLDNIDADNFIGTIDFGGPGEAVILRVDNSSVVHSGPWGPAVALTQNIDGYKEVNQLYKFRICDAFGGGAFEYNIAKNRFAQGIKLIQTCKPFQPLVAVIPDYDSSGLYGTSTEEKRGMISRGPYTMPRMSDAWVNYAQTNTNYQKSFDRSILNLEVNNSLSNIAADTAALLGVGSAAIGSATQGAFVGGPVGAVVGGVAGAVGSVAGAAVDRSLRLAAQRENIANAKEQFAFSIGNIKARPDSLAALSSFDYISSVSPYIEIYTCTDAEKDWYLDHLKFHGCAINRLGTFREAAAAIISAQQTVDITRFVSGTLMRCALPDPHMAMELSQELERGVYIYVDTVAA